MKSLSSKTFFLLEKNKQNIAETNLKIFERKRKKKLEILRETNGQIVEIKKKIELMGKILSKMSVSLFTTIMTIILKILCSIFMSKQSYLCHQIVHSNLHLFFQLKHLKEVDLKLFL